MSTKVAFRTGDGLTTEEGASRGIGKLVLNGGVLGDSDLLATQNGTPDNKVLVPVGDVLIGNNQPSSTLPDFFYHGWVTVAEQVTITANASGNPRIDMIVGYIDTTVNPTGLSDNPGVLKFAAVAGTAAATPAAPDDTAIAAAIGGSFPWVLIAQIAVANGFSSITTANITDKRPKALTLSRVLDDIAADFVVSGLIASQTSGLIGAISTGFAYVGGRLVFKPIVSKTFTASKDTYIDLIKTGKPTATNDYTFSEVSNGAAAPTLAAGSIRLAIVVTNGSAITSVTQSGGDSIGNLIYNTKPIVAAPGMQGWDGWQNVGEQWAYASASTITVPSGATSRYAVGGKIRIKQGGAYKYFYILAVASTVLTVTAGSVDTVANSVITDSYYSSADTPLGFPKAFTWAPAPGGYTGAVTVSTARFSISAGVVRGYVQFSGTSNNTGKTFSLPVAPKVSHRAPPLRVTDNGVPLNNPGYVDVAAGTLTAAAYTTLSSAGWTNSGTAMIEWAFIYEMDAP